VLKSIEDINATKKRLRIEIPSDVIEKEIGDSLEKLRQKAKIPGFRPGKSPISLIEKRFGKEVEAEVLDKVIPEYYSRALKEAEITPVATPIFEERLDFKRNNSLNLLFTVEVLPKIENLEYDNIKIKDIPVFVDEADVEEYLKKLREDKAVYEVAEKDAEKDVEKDDLVTFEYIGCNIIGEENPPSLKEQISEMGKEIFPLDIMEKVIGKKKGEFVEFNTTFDESCKSKELAGKTVEMKVLIKEIKKKNLPAIDDEFAKDLGFENITEMRERIRERLSALKKEQIEKIQKANIINKILESHKFEVPETLFRKELESLVMQESLSQKKSVEATLVADNLEQEKVIAPRSHEDAEKMQAELENRALRNVQASIIVDMIGKKEEIAVADNEVNERISLLAHRLSATPEAVRNFYYYREGSLEGLKHSIYEDKVMDLLLSKAVIEKGE
jgi:trigger factor